jgi:hypothetical protein
VVLAMVVVRTSLSGMPLERDEGEYAYAGQLMLQGVPPYRAAYNMKFPGVYAAYAAVLAACGQTAAGVHAGTTAVVAANVVLTFLLARRWPGGGSGIVAAATVAVLSTDPALLGLAGHATHFVLLPALAGLLVLSTADPGPARCAAAGALLATAMLMKQPGGAFLVAGAAMVVAASVARRWTRAIAARRLLAFAAGAVAPLLCAAGLLMHAGVFDRFWFWTVRYARYYGEQMPVGLAPSILWDEGRTDLRFAWPLWMLAATGLAVGWREPVARRGAALRCGLATTAFAATSVGFRYRAHYFILMAPAVALLDAAAVGAATEWLRRRRPALRWVPGAAFAAACAAFAVAARAVLFGSDPDAASRALYFSNPFVGAVEVGRRLRDLVPPGRTVAVLGSEPEICFEARRRSATGYLYTYGLMEDQPFAGQMQREMAAEITAARPAYVVLVRNDASWLATGRSDHWILGWCQQLIRSDPLVGVVPTVDAPARSYWGPDVSLPEARALARASTPCLLVFRHDGRP